MRNLVCNIKLCTCVCRHEIILVGDYFSVKVIFKGVTVVIFYFIL